MSKQIVGWIDRKYERYKKQNYENNKEGYLWKENLRICLTAVLRK